MLQTVIAETHRELERLAQQYQLDEVPERNRQKVEAIRGATTTDEVTALKKKAEESMFIHCLVHGKKYSAENLEKKAQQNLKMAEWKEDQGRDDEAAKARKRAEKYQKEAEKLRKKK